MMQVLHPYPDIPLTRLLFVPANCRYVQHW